MLKVKYLPLNLKLQRWIAEIFRFQSFLTEHIQFYHFLRCVTLLNIQSYSKLILSFDLTMIEVFSCFDKRPTLDFRHMSITYEERVTNLQYPLIAITKKHILSLPNINSEPLSKTHVTNLILWFLGFFCCAVSTVSTRKIQLYTKLV